MSHRGQRSIVGGLAACVAAAGCWLAGTTSADSTPKPNPPPAYARLQSILIQR